MKRLSEGDISICEADAKRKQDDYKSAGIYDLSDRITNERILIFASALREAYGKLDRIAEELPPRKKQHFAMTKAIQAILDEEIK